MLRSIVPWRERVPVHLLRFENEIEELMESFFGNGNRQPLARFAPVVNLSESDDKYEVSVELPGLKPEEVKVELKENGLWISGEKKEEKEEETKTFHRKEFLYGEFRRVIPLPSIVDESSIDATYEGGVLKISIPKSEGVKPREIPVKAK